MPTKDILFKVNRIRENTGCYGRRYEHIYTWETLPVNLEVLFPFARAVALRITTTYNGRLPAELILESPWEVAERYPDTWQLGSMEPTDHIKTTWRWDTLHDYPGHPKRSAVNNWGPETPESYLERHAAEMQRLGWCLR